MKLFFRNLLLFSILFQSSYGTLWRYDNALILEDDDDNAVNTDVEATTTFSPEEEIGDCLTNEGITGTCMKFDECYNYLNDTFSQNFVTELRDMVRNISTPCSIQEDSTLKLSPGGESVNPTEGAVCCATLARAAQSKNIPQYPSIPAQQDEFPEEAILAKSSGCGVSAAEPIQPAITNPTPAKIGEFPHLVAIFNQNKPHCGGSLIDSRTVITAAHCVNHIRTSAALKQLTLSIGDHDIYTTSEVKNQKRGVKRIAFHTKFNMNTFQDDIALVVLNEPVKFASNIKPICLNTKYADLSSGNRKGTIAGWGRTSTNGAVSRTVQKAENIQIWTNSGCNGKYRQAGAGIPQITAKMMCAGGGADGKDSCQGDSGGPLAIYADGQYFLAGIVSWGVNCGQYPGVYSRVDQYLTWINKYWQP